MNLHDISIWFDTAFICVPFVFTLCLPSAPKPEGDRARELRRIMFYLFVATLASLALMLFGHGYYEGTGNLALWALFFPLWFGGAMRIMPLKRPAWFENTAAQDGVRTAQLTSRIAKSPVPTIMWALPWLLVAAGAIFALTRIEDMGNPENILPLFMLCAAAFWAGFGQYGARWFLLEAEPLDDKGSDELVQAYDRLRRVKLWGWYACVVAATGIFCAVAVLVAADAGLTTTIWIGAGGGSAIGVFGGVFGTYCTVLRGRIQELRAGLSRDKS